ncbi:MAG: exodeoxyribonuclease V subunit gamma, partial [Desulfobulbaceae bacterium]|nr:exodeoxyribonuclease V subunit gamma [Desulfobulbaceae bacterium]
SLELARRQGVCANLECPFPATFVWRLFGYLAKPAASSSPFEGDGLLWAVMDRLPELVEQPAFAPLKNYLAVDAQPLRRYQLAARIADTFDQYLIYRPDWLKNWEAGQEEHWQAELWHSLHQHHGNEHRANLLFELLDSIDQSFIERAGLPSRLSLFGIPALPLAHFDVFARLAEQIDIHIFLLNPCRTLWEDLVSSREQAKITLRHVGKIPKDENLYYEVGNELLTSLGKLGQDFQRLIHSYDCHEESCFQPPDGENLLAFLQGDILDGINRGSEDRLPVATDDRSIVVHAAHSPMREVEILHDQLLALFDRDPDLQPRDVLVMAADIGRYAPYVEAVFSIPEDENLRIPFSIADRDEGETSPVIHPFLELLRLVGSRLPVGQVMALLENEPVRLRFGIGEEELPTIRNWLRDTNIHWGVDGDHRQNLGLGDSQQGTWLAGLDRLLLGYALPGGNRNFFADILPYDEIEGGMAGLLGRFGSFVEEVFRVMADFVTPRPLSQWRDDLLQLAERLLAEDDDYASDLQLLRDGLHNLAQGATAASYHEPVAVEAVVAHLASGFVGRSREGRFLSGQVTFCQMVPMRSIPFKVICLLGMDDGVFPRIDRDTGFDLMDEDFRIGDRSRRDDDRYLFLEALLSARDCFYLSFVGQSIRDNSKRPPSVVVSRLMEVIDRGFVFSAGKAEENLITHHPLQPFSPEYFSPQGQLLSYSQLNHRLADTTPAQAPWPGIFSGYTDEVGEEQLTVSVDEFVWFFANPARALIQRRFGLLLTEQEDELLDREPFSLNSLDRYRLRDDLVEAILADEEPAELGRIHRALGDIPDGVYGDLDFMSMAEEAGEFANRLQGLRGGDGGAVEIPVDLDLGRVRLVGALSVHPSGQYLYRPTKSANMSLRDTMRHWILHLLLNAVP